MQPPKNIQAIGEEIAVAWADGKESYFPMAYLRANSPSAETRGEVDILGNRHGGHGPMDFPGVTVTGWEFVGNYAVRFQFSDGHGTGLYSWDYLRELAPSC
jgi:DUF971 family protein